MGEILSLFLNEKKGGTEADEPKNKNKKEDVNPEIDEDTKDSDSKDTDKENTPEDTSDEDNTDDTKDNTDAEGDELFDDVDDIVDDNSSDDNGDSTDDENMSSDDGMDDGEESSDDSDNTDDMTDDTDASTDDTEEEPEPTPLKINQLKKAFLKLFNDTQEIIYKLNDSNKTASETEAYALSLNANNLEKLKNIMYDYLINIFDSKEYPENLYTYYSMVNSVKLTGNLVSKIIEMRNKG